jgi:hypothetical protein
VSFIERTERGGDRRSTWLTERRLLASKSTLRFRFGVEIDISGDSKNTFSDA